MKKRTKNTDPALSRITHIGGRRRKSAAGGIVSDAQLAILKTSFKALEHARADVLEVLGEAEQSRTRTPEERKQYEHEITLRDIEAMHRAVTSDIRDRDLDDLVDKLLIEARAEVRLERAPKEQLAAAEAKRQAQVQAASPHTTTTLHVDPGMRPSR
jgi:hypothetical protein